MRIAVMGTGGVGGYFGARLAETGNDVHFIARGRHLEAIRANGLKVLSGRGDIHLKPANATDDPATVGPVDMVIFTVKAYDTESAAELCRPLIGPDTGVVTFQNGVDSTETLSRVLGPGHVVGGVANISAIIESPGVVRHFAELQILRFGEMDDSRTPRVEAFAAACEAAGIDTHIVKSIQRELWTKFIFLASMSAANCLTRQALGPIRDDTTMATLLETLVDEAVAVGRAKGMPLHDDQKGVTMKTLHALPPAMKTSMLAALERGEKLEARHLSGAVARMGRELGVPTPTHFAAFASLIPFIDGTSRS